ncbi:MAG: deoxyhypusine synthase family protein [Desulfonatronovibrionaceae bacterium]
MSENKDDIRCVSSLKDPEDEGLKALQSLDPDQIEDFEGLLTAMGRTAFGGRSLGDALEVGAEMISDPECFVVGTFSGAMTVAKMGTLLCRMIDRGWINAVVSTGALMAHGFIESMGMKHYRYEPERMDDRELFKRGFNRVYDTLEPEKNFCQAEEVMHEIMSGVDKGEHLSSELICRRIGRHLSENFSGPGILKSAYENDVPVYIPAFTDSELALDIATHILSENPEALEEQDPRHFFFQFNPFLDLFSYTRKICSAPRTGIFTIGGGVPRNWAQQVSPFLEIASQRLEREFPLRRFQYGVRICPEPVHWGGLSGCTYGEGVSWGKFVPPEQGGRFAEVPADATLVWPLLFKGLEQRLAKKKKP